MEDVFGIFKAYCTRVGSGPFPTELFDDVGARMGKVGNEFGATTGRSRRCGWIDLPALKYAININGVTKLMMMKGDVLSGIDKIKVCTHYHFNGEKIDYLPFEANDELTPIFDELEGWQEDLMSLDKLVNAPKAFHDYIAYLERELETPITIVSVGPDRKQTFFK
jgi:adenylosuccinate synthase